MPALAPRETGWGLLALGQQRGRCLSVAMCHNSRAVLGAAGHDLFFHGLAGTGLSWGAAAEAPAGFGAVLSTTGEPAWSLYFSFTTAGT